MKSFTPVRYLNLGRKDVWGARKLLYFPEWSYDSGFHTQRRNADSGFFHSASG